MTTKEKNPDGKLVKRLGVIALVTGLITTVAFPSVKYANGRFNTKIKNVVKVELSKGLRDMKILVEYNRMQAKKDSSNLADWNNAIDFIDNGGTVR